MAKFGRAGIGWSSTEDSNTERFHLLESPLMENTASHTMSVWRSESLDKTAVQTFHTGNGAYEFVGKVRFDNHAGSLIDLIKAGSQGKTLTYYPNLNDPDVSHACSLIAPLTPTDLQLDPQRGEFGEQAIELRLRKTDETPFPSLMQGSNVLFAYRAGDSLAQATFSRADTAHYVSKGLGTLTSAASGKARLTWLSTVGSTGVRNTPALLLERSQTNRVIWSERLSSWPGTATLTSGQADPKGGTAAWLVADNSTTATVDRTLSVTITSATRAGVSIFLRQGTTAAAGGMLWGLYDATAGTYRASATYTWSSGRPTQVVNTGSSWMAPEAYRGGWWRVTLRTTTVMSTGSAFNVALTPAAASVGAKGNVYAYGAQVE